MRDMPKSVEPIYLYWISAFPESWHPNDLERFYMFVSVLLTRGRKERSRYWLAENLRQDCPKLSDDDIQEYCDIYEHLRDFHNVWNSQQVKLLLRDEQEKNLENLKRKLDSNRS